MDKNSIHNSSVPDQATIPEEDATLLAIEALEARSVDPNPRPWNAPREISVPERPAVAPKVIEPIIAKPVDAQPPKPHAEPEPAVHTAPVDIKPVPKPPVPAPAPLPVVAPKPKKHLTPSEKMAEELASAPAPSRFQFFSYRNPPRKPFIIIGVIVVLIGLGVAAYFATR